MLYVVELLETRQTLVVGLQDGSSLNPLYAILRKVWCHLVENECCNTLVLIVWSHTDEQQVEVGHSLRLKCPQKVEPSKWEESSLALTQRLRERRHTQSHRYNLVVLVGHHRNKIEIEQREVHIAVVLLLSRCHWLIVVDLLICSIQNIEVAIAISALQLSGILHLDGVDFVASCNYLHQALHSLGSLGRRSDLILNPVGLLCQSVSLVVRYVVGVRVETRHRRIVVETLQQQTLMVKVGESHRAIPDYLVGKGLPFRDAYKATGELVALCIKKGLTLETLPLEEYKAVCDIFDEGVFDAINLDKCVNDRTSLGGPAPQNVLSQVQRVKELNK